jgi:CRP-like cAMP-binding protein
MTKLIQVLRQIAPLTDQDCKRLTDITKTIELQKGDYWIEAGKKNNSMAFVEEGYLRRFYTKNGEEITSFFYFANDISADLPSLVGNPLSKESIVAMEKTTLTVFSYEEFCELCNSIPALEHLHRVIFQFAFLRFYNMTMSSLVKTAEERYDELLARYPQLLQNATQYHIASYLGVSPQHLGRIRS